MSAGRRLHGFTRRLFYGRLFVDHEDAFQRQPDALAAQLGYETQVIKRVDGYGPLQVYLAFQEILKDYQPDVVLLGFFTGNDVRNNSRELESPITTSSPKVDCRSACLEHIQVVFGGAQRRYVAVKERRNSWGKRLAR